MTEDRGISEVLGYSLIFGIVLVSITIVSVGGVDSLQAVRDAEQVNNAERGFGVLADNTADIYERNAPSRATELSIGEAQLYTGTNTTISITDAGAGTWNAEIDVTPLVFETDQGHKLIYEAGAVFRTREDSGTIVRPPPHLWGTDRRVLTLVATQAKITQALSGTEVLARMKARNKTVLLGPRDSALDTPRITIDSERADLWMRYLSERPGIESSTCTKPSATEVQCDVVDSGPYANNLLITVHKIEVQIEQ